MKKLLFVLIALIHLYSFGMEKDAASKPSRKRALFADFINSEPKTKEQKIEDLELQLYDEKKEFRKNQNAYFNQEAVLEKKDLDEFNTYLAKTGKENFYKNMLRNEKNIKSLKNEIELLKHGRSKSLFLRKVHGYTSTKNIQENKRRK